MDIKEKIWKNSLNTCEYVEGFENTKSTITVKCIKHDYIFQTKFENVRHNRPHLICPYCKQEEREQRYKNSNSKVKCAYCGKIFYKRNSALKSSKSGLQFCCREHKDLAQRIDFGLSEIQPEHYGIVSTNYRIKAFRYYPHKCAVCGWNEDEDILEVHHINENRECNDLDNLIILCPNCHRKLTSHKYKLVNREEIRKIDM